MGDVTAGTLGGVFRNSDGQLVAVSNAHVMCESDTNIINQAAGRRRLGTVQKCFAPDTPSFPPGGPVSGFFDAAICSIDDGRPSTVAEIAEIGTATAISSPRIGDVVRKRGFKTGLSHGVVEGILGSYNVNDDQGNLKWVMLGQVSIVMIPDLGLNPLGVWSRGGDSGSVVVNNSNEIVALHWGGDRMPVTRRTATGGTPRTLRPLQSPSGSACSIGRPRHDAPETITCAFVLLTLS